MSDDAHRRLIDECPDGVLVHSQGIIVLANREAARVVGHAEGRDLIGKPVLSFVHPDDRDSVLQRIREGQASGKRNPPAELRILRPDGSVAYVETTAVPTTFGGKVAHYVMVRDIQDRIRARDMDREQRVARKLVRQMIETVARESTATASARRALGRDLARQAEARRLEDHLDAFASMGIGRLKLLSAHGGRHEFQGEDLLDVQPRSAQPTCHLALGYLEGAVEVLTSLPALGNEMECASQGRKACRFVVKTRA